MNRTTSGAVTPITSRRRAAATVYGATSRRGATSPRGRAEARPSTRATRLRTLTHDGEEGFTLVELLVVVLMLVALVGIAVPTFVGQQERAERAAVQSELRSAAIALESFRAQNGEYAVTALTSPAFGFVRSLDVATYFHADDFSAESFCVRAWYDEVSPGETHDPDDADADKNAEWAITERGLAYVGSGGTSRSCPSPSDLP